MLFAGYCETTNNYRFLFLCPNDNCGRYYKGINGKHNLKRHLLYECGVEPQFRCQFCQKRFTQKSSLKAHLSMKHGLRYNYYR